MKKYINRIVAALLIAVCGSGIALEARDAKRHEGRAQRSVSRVESRNVSGIQVEVLAIYETLRQIPQKISDEEIFKMVENISAKCVKAYKGDSKTFANECLILKNQIDNQELVDLYRKSVKNEAMFEFDLALNIVIARHVAKQSGVRIDTVQNLLKRELDDAGIKGVKVVKSKRVAVDAEYEDDEEEGSSKLLKYGLIAGGVFSVAALTSYLLGEKTCGYKWILPLEKEFGEGDSKKNSPTKWFSLEPKEVNQASATV